MADVSISRPDLKGLLSLEKRVLAQRVLDLHDELVRERARRVGAHITMDDVRRTRRYRGSAIAAVMLGTRLAKDMLFGDRGRAA